MKSITSQLTTFASKVLADKATTNTAEASRTTKTTLTPSGPTRQVEACKAAAPRAAALTSAPAGPLRRLFTYVASKFADGPSFEQAYAQKYMASLSPENAAVLLSALTILARIKDSGPDHGEVTQALQDAGRERLASLASDVTATVRTNLATAAKHEGTKPGAVSAAYQTLLEQIGSHLHAHSGKDASPAERRAMLHAMLDLLVIDGSLAVDDLRAWAPRLPHDEKRALLDVDGAHQSRLGEVLREDTERNAKRFADAGQALAALTDGDLADVNKAASCVDGVQAAAAALGDLAKALGAQDGKAACAEMGPGFVDLHTQLGKKVTQFAEANRTYLQNLDPSHLDAFIHAASALGADATSMKPSEVAEPLPAEEGDSARSRDEALNRALMAGSDGHLEDMAAALHQAIQHHHATRSADEAAAGNGAAGAHEADMATRDWAAGQVDALAASDPDALQRLTEMLGSPNGQRFAGRLSQVLQTEDPGRNAEARSAPTQREVRDVEVAFGAIQEHLAALAAQDGLVMLP